MALAARQLLASPSLQVGNPYVYSTATRSRLMCCLSCLHTDPAYDGSSILRLMFYWTAWHHYMLVIASMQLGQPGYAVIAALL